MDLLPTSGQLTFDSLNAYSTITLTVFDDKIPENDELFNVTLTSPQGGATLASSSTTAQVTITANDSPLRFAQSVVEINESNGSVVLLVQRGILNGGTVGQLAVESTVDYSVTAGTATAGEDYTPSFGTLIFPSGSTSQTFSIVISDDSMPEGVETFQVVLSNASSDAVLYNPSTVIVEILPNDNVSGVVRFCSTAAQEISEDDGTIASFCIERTVGTLNDLAIAWSVRDSLGQLALEDFSTTSGSVLIPDGLNQTVLELQATDDTKAEEAEMFTVSIDQVVDGGGKLDSLSLLVAPLLVADSDDVYGVVEIDSTSGSITVCDDVSDLSAAFATLMNCFLSYVPTQGKRCLEFQLTRSGGSVEDISVVYHVLYLPQGTTDPNTGLAGSVTEEFGTVVISAGLSATTVTLDIYSNAFLAQGDQLYVELNNTVLNPTGIGHDSFCISVCVCVSISCDYVCALCIFHVL